jgi:flagellar basal body-associated protein FliL
MSAIPVSRIARALLSLAIALALFAGSTAFATAPAKRAALPDEFVPFDAITVSVLERMRVRGFLTVEFGLYVSDRKLRDEIDTSRRALKDAYIRVLADYGADVANVSAAPDVAGIAVRLQRVTDSVLGKAGARVLLSQAQLRKLH